VLRIYENSLSIAMLSLFALAFVGHLVTGTHAFNADQVAHGEATVSPWGFLFRWDFWFQSLQNWQSEFLAVGVLVVFSVYLRNAVLVPPGPVLDLVAALRRRSRERPMALLCDRLSGRRLLRSCCRNLDVAVVDAIPTALPRNGRSQARFSSWASGSGDAGTKEATMQSTTSGRDVAQLIRDQHVEINRLFSEVAYGRWDSRRAAFDSLVRLIAVHEAAEEEIVYPVVRSQTGGDEIAATRLAEEREAKRMLADLEQEGIDGDSFEARFTVLRDAVLRHASSEEETVLPLLVASQDQAKLDHMARAVQVAVDEEIR
jgi:hemerythrin superfamily protein